MNPQDLNPPSYDHTMQQTTEVSYMYGKYNDASLDSYERGELFTQAFANQLDRCPTHELQEIQTRGYSNCIQLEIGPHPSASPSQPSCSRTGPNTYQIWPSRPTQPDLDLSLQASHPYQQSFQMTVLEKSPETVLAIGLSTKPYPIFRMPGWNRYSVGYHSDDGHKFCDDAAGGVPYGPSWTVGDTVGCVYQAEEGKVYFTLNGFTVGDAFVGLGPHYYYPTIGADGYAHVKIDFY